MDKYFHFYYFRGLFVYPKPEKVVYW